MPVNAISLHSVEISAEAKELWQEATQAGIRFQIQDKTNMLLKTDFNGMQIPDAKTYRDIQHSKTHYEARIKSVEKQILKLVLLRTRLQELLDILENAEIDETNADLLESCLEALTQKLHT